MPQICKDQAAKRSLTGAEADEYLKKCAAPPVSDSRTKRGARGREARGPTLAMSGYGPAVTSRMARPSWPLAPTV